MIFFVLLFHVSSPAQQIHPPKSLAEKLLEDQTGATASARDRGYSIEEVINSLYMRGVDLNDDDKEEIILYGLVCGQNCSHWVYRVTEFNYEQIPFEGTLHALKVLATKSYGYHDLQGTQIVGCCEGELRTYQYDGSGYVQTMCRIERYGIKDKRGVFQRSKVPQIIGSCEDRPLPRRKRVVSR